MRLREAYHSALGRWAMAVVVLCLALFALDRFFPPPLSEVQTSVVITDENGEWLHGFTVREGEERRWRLKAKLDEIDPVFLERLILIEDKRFYDHIGVDLLAVMRATGSLVRQGEVVSGASTISMQTARLLEPRPRNIGSKLVEMVRAIQLEARLSKSEILELYLTLAPYGGNLEGVRAASLAYFGKEPTHLTDAQQALLISLPQAPEARRPDRKSKNAKQARARLLQKMVTNGSLSVERAREANEASIPASRQPFARHAWHIAFEQQQSANEGGDRKLTLNAPLQRRVEGNVAAHADELMDQAGIAVLVIENDSLKVRASIGSAALTRPGGWIDMTRAERSPGSTLKPFIYGLAFDDGYAGGETLIDDAPYSFDGYRPENFSRAFHGDVTVSEALQHSLNVPAVLALDRIGPKRFAASLGAAGVETSLPQTADNKASLAIALGGLGMNARDLGMLYAGLANDGQIAPLRWHEGQAQEEAYQLIKPQNAKRLTKIMREAPMPEGRMPALLSQDAPLVAFKTGTSYGYRDAWAAGYTDRYTVITWVGHPSGTPRPGETGREAALPLMFDIFDTLHEFDAGQSKASEEGEDKLFTSGDALARLSPMKREMAPEIVFPEDGVTIYFAEAEAERGFALSARGGAGGYQWYVDGKLIHGDELGNRSIWVPDSEGFYQVTVVDKKGRKTVSSVRVVSAG